MGLSKLFGVLDVFSELSRLESRVRNSNSVFFMHFQGRGRGGGGDARVFNGCLLPVGSSSAPATEH